MGITTYCYLSKKCVCTKEVTFIEETVFNVVLAGLYGREMQECNLHGNFENSDINSLVEFCSAEESERKSFPKCWVNQEHFNQTS